MRWHKPVNELCRYDGAGALEGFSALLAVSVVWKRHEMIKHTWPCSFAGTEAAGMASGCGVWVSVGPDDSVSWRSGLLLWSAARWSSVCVTCARNWKWRARWYLLTAQVLLPACLLPSFLPACLPPSLCPTGSLPPPLVEKLTPSGVKKTGITQDRF